MTFFPLPDEFYADPQFAGLPGDAIALWARAGSWSAHQGTDGAIKADMVPLLLQQLDPQSPNTLVQRGIWKRTRGGFQFVVWPKLASRAYVEAKREDARQRQERFRRKKAKSVTRDERVSHDQTNGVTNDSQSSPVHLSLRERDGRLASSIARASPADRAAAIAACSMCDADGYAGRVLCDHDPEATGRAARGRAAVQAALPKRKPKPPERTSRALDDLAALVPKQPDTEPSTEDPPT